jgi:hypothetical protein
MGMLIAYLLGILTAITPEDQHRRHNAKSSDSSEGQPFPNRTLSVVCIPPTLTDEERTEKKKKKRRKTIIFWIEIASLIVFFVYATFTILIWRANKKSADAATIASNAATESLKETRKQFQLDQRPYVAVFAFQMIDKTNKAAPAVKGRPLVVGIQIKNVGKSPALNTITHRHLIFGESNIEQFRGEPPDTEKIGNVIAQGEWVTTTAVSIKDTFANETADISRDEIVMWDGTSPIIVFGRITYEDTFGNSYCTPYASRYLGPGNWERVTNMTVKSTGFSRRLTDLCPEGTGKIF